VCAAQGVPTTLKMRTGWDMHNKNAVAIAQRAQAAGIQMLTIHGRTREQGYGGQAEYNTIAEVVAAVDIPVVANGDIGSPEKAEAVLQATGAQAVMIGRAAQGRPWIFREIVHYLSTGQHLPGPRVEEAQQALLEHLLDHYGLYGTYTGVRSARKHIAWYVRDLPGGDAFRTQLNLIEDCDAQWQAVKLYFEGLAAKMERLEARVNNTG
jgi:tRNA-dihydrouridine synthase B